MKFKIVLIGALVLFPLISSKAHALTFSDTLLFNGGSGVTVQETLFNFEANPFWTHDIHDDLGGLQLDDISILDATLTLNYGNTNGATIAIFFFNPESWGIEGLGLLNSVGNTATNQSLILGAVPLAGLQATGLYTAFPQEFSLNLLDLVQRDTFRLYSSTLSGNFVPHAPEPASILLTLMGLGMGMLGIRHKH